MQKKLKRLIDESKKILIFSHAGPDPDAISSTIFVKKVLEVNFPKKRIIGNIEGANLSNFSLVIEPKEIETKGVSEIITSEKPDLIIFLDSDDIKTASRSDFSQAIKPYFDNKTVVLIDHHTKNEDYKKYPCFINHFDNSCAETVYKVFIKQLKLKEYSGFANHLLLGIVGDTGSFGYLKQGSDIKSTFDITYELLSKGGNIDFIRTAIGRISSEQLRVHQEY